MAKPDVLLVEGRKPGAAGYIAVEIITLGDQSRLATADSGGAHLIVVARPDDPLRTQQPGAASKLEKRFAKEGYAVVVHPDNPLKSVTGAQVTGILDRSITDWSVLGAPSGAIQLHLPLEGTPARQLLREAMGRQLPSGGTSATESEVANSVFGDKNGAGLVPLRHVSQSRPLDLILGDEGRRLPIPINEFSIATGDYPFTQTLFLRPASDSGNSYVPAFIQYVRSDPGQDVVATKAHLVDLRVSPRAIALPPFYLGVIPKEVVDRINLATTAQIPVVFRFEIDRADNPKGVSTDAQLVSASEDAMEKVVSLLFQPRNRDKIMLLFGHTDSTGPSGHNYDLSKNRATTIETLFKRKLVPNRIHAIGLSDQVPLDDNDTDPGRARNRRVEIFVADVKS